MRVAIMQPTWLPWSGYFDLIDQVDLFVFLDSVQYSDRSWQSRNRVRTSKGLEWISLPVRASRRDGTTISEAQVLAGPTRIRKWTAMLKQTYARASAVETELPFVAEILQSIEDNESLASVNIRLIENLAGHLNITTPTIRASALPDFRGRVDRLVAICKNLGADTYVSPPGAAGYIHPDRDKFIEAGIELKFHRYDHPFYRQCHAPFMAYASAIDLLFNQGSDSRSVLLSGQRSPVPASEFYDEAEPVEGFERSQSIA